MTKVFTIAALSNSLPFFFFSDLLQPLSLPSQFVKNCVIPIPEIQRKFCRANLRLLEISIHPHRQLPKSSVQKSQRSPFPRLRKIIGRAHPMLHLLILMPGPVLHQALEIQHLLHQTQEISHHLRRRMRNQVVLLTYAQALRSRLNDVIFQNLHHYPRRDQRHLHARMWIEQDQVISENLEVFLLLQRNYGKKMFGLHRHLVLL